MKRDFDLFGHPLPRNLGEVGRNEHVPTKENVSRVRQLVMSNWTAVQIAEELGISRPTLRKHYLPDINKARVAVLGEIKAKQVINLEKAADDGNVAAMKELLRMVREGELDQGLGAAPPAQDPAQPKTPKLGKKEEANAAAQTGQEGTEWRNLLN